jgi:hypothetical protein
MTGSLLLCSDDRFGSWLCKNADVRKTDGRIISPIANFVARILMRDRTSRACQSCHSPRRNYLGGSGLLVIVAKPGEQFYTDAVGQRAHPSRIKLPVTPRRNTSGANGRAQCTIRDATAIMRQLVCWRLKIANLITANFISLWLPHGSRSLATMRQ